MKKQWMLGMGWTALALGISLSLWLHELPSHRRSNVVINAMAFCCAAGGFMLSARLPGPKEQKRRRRPFVS